MSELADFKELFRGREDAWGAVTGAAIKRPLTDADFVDHLFCEGSIGQYPLRAQDGQLAVAWGCTDIDEGLERSLPLAKNMRKALRLLGLTAWVERSKGKGYHVWVFVEGWVDATSMRHALLAAHQLAGVTPAEVNPKQLSTEHLKVGLGNYVNLPYAKKWADEGRRVVLDAFDDPLPLDAFTKAALENRATTASVARAAMKYVEPPPKAKVTIESTDAEVAELTPRMSPLAWTIFTNGPLDGMDRSSTQARLAHRLREQGDFTPAEALKIMVDADNRWGKFADRHDQLEQLERLVVNAWQ